jgi:hypothetical protein
MRTALFSHRLLGLRTRRSSLSREIQPLGIDCFEQATGSTSETRRGLTVPCSLQGSNMSSRGRNPREGDPSPRLRHPSSRVTERGEGGEGVGRFPGALPPATHLTPLGAGARAWHYSTAFEAARLMKPPALRGVSDYCSAEDFPRPALRGDQGRGRRTCSGSRAPSRRDSPRRQIRRVGFMT